ncbi:MAG: hypothetical protein PVH24_04005 [Candidatus Zixiibacteriota bacterium]|jgi:hypothetical protein
MGLDFISRTLRTSGILLLIFLPFGLYYMGVFPTLAVFSGGIWGLVNLIFLSQLIRTVIIPGKVDTGRAIGLAVIKFPLLYLAGYFLITVKQFDPLLLLAGFSVFLAVMILKVLGRVVLGLDKQHGANRNLQEMI